jgi:hypothetical protein
MKTTTLPAMLEQVLEAGVEVTLFLNKGVVYYNLNTGAKSHMHLFEVDGKYYVDMRYDEIHEVSDFEQLVSLCAHAMHGQTYVSNAWRKVLTDRGYL